MATRLDHYLVQQNHCQSRTQSQKLIRSGCVRLLINGKWQIASKPSQLINELDQIEIQHHAEQHYVSRAGLKLEGALRHTKLSIENKSVLDVGQSTGGFTHCLLEAGAMSVTGIDVGRDQLAQSLKKDARVQYFEGLNARYLTPEHLAVNRQTPTFDVIVMDVSFISQSLILPQLPVFLRKGGSLLSLVKPQFEVGKDNIGKGGIVRDDSLYPRIENRLKKEIEELGLHTLDFFPSPIKGGDGNREFFLYAQKSS